MSDDSITGDAFVPQEPRLARSLEDAQVKSIVESLLFAAHQPISFLQIKDIFHGVTLRVDKAESFTAFEEAT